MELNNNLSTITNYEEWHHLLMDSSKEVVKNVRDLQSTITMDEHKHLFEYMANVTIDGRAYGALKKYSRNFEIMKKKDDRYFRM